MKVKSCPEGVPLGKVKSGLEVGPFGRVLLAKYFCLITFLAVDDFWSIWMVSSGDFFLTFVASSLVQLAAISGVDAVLVAAIEALFGDWGVVSSVEL